MTDAQWRRLCRIFERENRMSTAKARDAAHLALLALVEAAPSNRADALDRKLCGSLSERQFGSVYRAVADLSHMESRSNIPDFHVALANVAAQLLHDVLDDAGVDPVNRAGSRQKQSADDTGDTVDVTSSQKLERELELLTEVRTLRRRGQRYR